MNPSAPRSPIAWSQLKNPWVFLGTGFGSGMVSNAPGTAGSVAIWCLAVFFPELTRPESVLTVAVVGPLICGRACRQLGAADHPGVVWDEWSGMLLTLAFIPFNLYHWLVAFLLFRVFDIAKPWPIRWLDQKIHGGIGIMADDWLAALFAVAVFYGVMWWF